MHSTNINLNVYWVPSIVLIAGRSAVGKIVFLPVLVIYYCIKNYLKLSGLKKQTNIYYLIVSEDQELRIRLAGWL